MDTMFFLFTKPEGYTFKAGQYCTVWLEKDVEPSRDVKHTFSFTSDPGSDHVRFATRIRQTTFKKRISSLEPNDTVYLGVPGGSTIEDKENVDMIFIIGGIGITPVLSYLESLVPGHPKIKILWSNRDNSTTPFFNEFTTGKYSHIEDLEVVFVTTRSDEGAYRNTRIDQSIVSEHLGDHQNSKIHIYGSENFVDDISSFVAGCGIPWDQIQSESFAGY